MENSAGIFRGILLVKPYTARPLVINRRVRLVITHLDTDEHDWRRHNCNHLFPCEIARILKIGLPK